MSRVIRRVPLDWQHPTYRQRADELGLPCLVSAHLADQPQPMFDQTFTEAINDYAVREQAWLDQTDPQYDPRFSWEEWAGAERPTDPRSYRPAWDEPANGIQLYETISEGTPLPYCPVFADTAAGFRQLCEWAAQNCSTFGPMDSGYNASAEGWAEYLTRGGASAIVGEFIVA